MKRAASRAAGARWRLAPPSACSAEQKDWLTRAGSLTRHLQALGQVEVEVVCERVAQAWGDEWFCLTQSARVPMWTREVVLRVDGVPFVAAHSVAPLAASRGVWQAMRRLRTRPLAELLYADPTVSRSALAGCSVGARHPLYRLAAPWIGGAAPHRLLARRSVFARAGAPLLVTECMLPALWARTGRGGPALLPAR